MTCEEPITKSNGYCDRMSACMQARCGCNPSSMPVSYTHLNHMTMPEDCKVTIDEIKGMYMKLDLLDDAVGVHLSLIHIYQPCLADSLKALQFLKLSVLSRR